MPEFQYLISGWVGRVMATCFFIEMRLEQISFGSWKNE